MSSLSVTMYEHCLVYSMHQKYGEFTKGLQKSFAPNIYYSQNTDNTRL